TVLRDDMPVRRRIAAARPLFLLMIAITLGYLCMRSSVQRDLTGFIPYPIFRFLRMSAIDRIGTMMNEMPRIARLLVFPVQLSAGWLARSVDRQRVWQNNDVFFQALMKDAPNGYRAHFMYARHVGLKSRLSEMEREYRRAIRIFPYDAAMTISVADAYTRVG